MPAGEQPLEVLLQGERERRQGGERPGGDPAGRPAAGRPQPERRERDGGEEREREGRLREVAVVDVRAGADEAVGERVRAEQPARSRGGDERRIRAAAHDGGQSATPPSTTARASTPARASRLAARAARGPLSQTVTTGLPSVAPAPSRRTSR